MNLSCAGEAWCRSHILFVLVDDMGWHFPAYHGNAEVRTPTIDALARVGVRLEAMYAYHMCSQ